MILTRQAIYCDLCNAHGMRKHFIEVPEFLQFDCVSSKNLPFPSIHETFAGFFQLQNVNNLRSDLCFEPCSKNQGQLGQVKLQKYHCCSLFVFDGKNWLDRHSLNESCCTSWFSDSSQRPFQGKLFIFFLTRQIKRQLVLRYQLPSLLQ